MMKPLPARERVTELLRYDADSGELWWRVAAQGRRLDRPAGTLHARGYRQIRIDGVLCMAHALAWFLTYGLWPQQLDHANLDKSDNRICNLRQATTAQNKANSKVRRDNISGIKGVQKDRERWRARIRVNGELINLGSFATADEASKAYAVAAGNYFGEFARVC